MSSTFTTTSGSLTFLAYDDGWSEDPKLAYEVIEFPGGDAVAVSVGGLRETRRSLSLLLDSLDDYRLLASIRGESGYLEIEDWDVSSVAAMLVVCQPEGRIWASGQVSVKATFILL